MTHQFRPRGVCSRKISFDLENGIIRNVHFEGGCNGNTQGLARLAEGMPARELVQRLAGIRCGLKDTSCPDQLAQAVTQALRKMHNSKSDSEG